LPASYEPWKAGPFFLSKGGLNFPIPVWAAGHVWAVVGLLLGCVGGWAYRHRALRRFEATGQARSLVWAPLAGVLVGGVVVWLGGGSPTEMNVPSKGEFAIEHGGALTPEFLAVLLGLTFYTSAFVAEVVRAGIQSVSVGQGEAAAA